MAGCKRPDNPAASPLEAACDERLLPAAETFIRLEKLSKRYSKGECWRVVLDNASAAFCLLRLLW